MQDLLIYLKSNLFRVLRAPFSSSWDESGSHPPSIITRCSHCAARWMLFPTQPISRCLEGNGVGEHRCRRRLALLAHVVQSSLRMALGSSQGIFSDMAGLRNKRRVETCHLPRRMAFFKLGSWNNQPLLSFQQCQNQDLTTEYEAGI